VNYFKCLNQEEQESPVGIAISNLSKSLETFIQLIGNLDEEDIRKAYEYVDAKARSSSLANITKEQSSDNELVFTKEANFFQTSPAETEVQNKRNSSIDFFGDKFVMEKPDLPNLQTGKDIEEALNQINEKTFQNDTDLYKTSSLIKCLKIETK
jgi:hypothetical protein